MIRISNPRRLATTTVTLPINSDTLNSSNRTTPFIIILVNVDRRGDRRRRRTFRDRVGDVVAVAEDYRLHILYPPFPEFYLSSYAYLSSIFAGRTPLTPRRRPPIPPGA